jgi:hypothetical protein
MRYAIDFPGTAFARIVTSGVADAATFEEMHRRLVGDDRFEEGGAILADHSDLDMRELGYGDVRRIADSLRALARSFAGSRVAVVAPTVLTRAVARETILMAPEADLTVEFFDSADEALEWLAPADA